MVLVLAAIQLPKYWRTRAENPAETPPVIVTAPSDIPASTPAPVWTPVPIETVQQPAAQRLPEQRAVNAQTLSQPAMHRYETPPGAKAPAEPVVRERQAPPPPQTSPAAAPAADSAHAAEIQEVREQVMLLGTRAGAVKTSLANLQREQSRQGLGLRADIAASAQRMEYYLDETEAAVKRGDTAAAKKNLDLAERTVSKLESFLGH